MTTQTILREYLTSRIRDEIAREANQYHHMVCDATGFYGGALSECDCDGPERTAAQLEALLAIVDFSQMLRPEISRLLLELVAGVGYAKREDFPRAALRASLDNPA